MYIFLLSANLTQNVIRQNDLHGKTKKSTLS